MVAWAIRKLGQLLLWTVGDLARAAAVAVTAAALWLGLARGWGQLLAVGAVSTALAALLAWLSPPLFARLVRWPLHSLWRRLWVYRRHWQPAIASAGLDLDGRLPRLLSVRTGPEVDRVRLRLLPHQTVLDYAEQGEGLAQTFGLLDLRARSLPARPHEVELLGVRRDPLRDPVPPCPVPEVVDLSAVEVGRREDGTPFRVPVVYSHLLAGGATGSGKGSVLWSLLAGLGPAIRDGVVRVWAIDPKGGMELSAGAPLFERFVWGEPRDDAPWQAPMVELLETAVRGMQARAARLRAAGVRKHVPTAADPLRVVVVDELAALSAYVADPVLRKRAADALSLLLSQGRAVGYVVVAATQDVRKETVGFRDLFRYRIGLRSTEAPAADMLLGAGARARGARTDRIPDNLPGVGYVVVEDTPDPVRVRFAYLDDEAVTAVAELYAPTGRAAA